MPDSPTDIHGYSPTQIRSGLARWESARAYELANLRERLERAERERDDCWRRQRGQSTLP
jgi:hypothetical protein